MKTKATRKSWKIRVLSLLFYIPMKRPEMKARRESNILKGRVLKTELYSEKDWCYMPQQFELGFLWILWKLAHKNMKLMNRPKGIFFKALSAEHKVYKYYTAVSYAAGGKRYSDERIHIGWLKKIVSLIASTFYTFLLETGRKEHYKIFCARKTKSKYTIEK